MLGGKKVVVVMPGLNVRTTIERTVEAIPKEFVDAILFVDDGGNDGGDDVARELGCLVVKHRKNLGYGAAQKTGYREALAMGADVAVMVHPDYQYKPELVPAMASMIVHGGYDVVLGSRLLVRGALKGGMPLWKFFVNRGLTVFENTLMGAGLSEYHTGYRAFSRRTLLELPLAENRNDFVFDNELLAQAIDRGLAIGELLLPSQLLRRDADHHVPPRRALRRGLCADGERHAHASPGAAPLRPLRSPGPHALGLDRGRPRRRGRRHQRSAPVTAASARSGRDS